MAIAFASRQPFATLQRLCGWLLHDASRQADTHHDPDRINRPAANQAFRAARPLPQQPRHVARPQHAARPLRVVHRGAGRMVISGRLSDVCAELDRLAAQEAQALAPCR